MPSRPTTAKPHRGRPKIGGARSGAGRPPAPPGTKYVPLNLTVRPEVKAGAVAAAETAEQSTSAWVSEAIELAATERCLFCGAAVTPGQLIGNMLANGAMPKMAEHAARATRLYTDELGALRKRVAELEALHGQAGALIATLSSVDGAAGALAQAAGPDAAFRVFTALREQLLAAHICLACGAHTPGRHCQCENDE